MLQNLKLKFSFIGLTETWLNSDNYNLYYLQNYNMLHNYRCGRSGGGVALYIDSTFNFKSRKDMSVMDDSIETIFAEIDKGSTGLDKDIIIGVIYRAPNSDLSVFNDKLSQILSKANLNNKYLYLLGDFNVDLLQTQKHSMTKDFIDSMFCKSLFPVISNPPE